MRRETDLNTRGTRAGAAWLAVFVMLFLALLMLVFVLQNNHRVALEFLWADFTLPVGVALLLAAVLGGLLVVLFGAARVLQLRLAARRHRKGHTTAPPPVTEPAPPTDRQPLAS